MKITRRTCWHSVCPAAVQAHDRCGRVFCWKCGGSVCNRKRSPEQNPSPCHSKTSFPLHAARYLVINKSRHSIGPFCKTAANERNRPRCWWPCSISNPFVFAELGFSAFIASLAVWQSAIFLNHFFVMARQADAMMSLFKHWHVHKGPVAEPPSDTCVVRHSTGEKTSRNVSRWLF